MKEFDFVRAWKEAAYPGFLSLPQNIRDLFWETHIKADDIRQDANLDLPWPANDLEFKNKFDEIPAEELAKAARIIYCFGHWGFSLCNKTGNYWKFSKYADQSLRKRLGLPETSNNDIQNGYGIIIYEGLLRVCFSHPHLWKWKEIGLATKTNYDKALCELSNIEIAHGLKSRKLWNKLEDRFDKISEDLKNKLMPNDLFLIDCIDVSKFMDEKESIKHRNWY